MLSSVRKLAPPVHARLSVVKGFHRKTKVRSRIQRQESVGKNTAVPFAFGHAVQRRGQAVRVVCARAAVSLAEEKELRVIIVGAYFAEIFVFVLFLVWNIVCAGIQYVVCCG